MSRQKSWKKTLENMGQNLTPEEHIELQTRASMWTSCAVGEQLGALGCPSGRRFTTTVLFHQLETLGQAFHKEIEEEDWIEAARTRQAIAEFVAKNKDEIKHKIQLLS